MRKPDLVKANRRSWAIRMTEEMRLATVGGYIIDYPGANAFWHWWGLTAVHLRPGEGLAPAKLHFPGATHEVVIAAHNPEEPDPDPDVMGSFHPMEPLDLVKQVVATDEEVQRLLELMNRAIVEDGASPDQDFRRRWEATIDNTLRHAEHRLDGHRRLG